MRYANLQDYISALETKIRAKVPNIIAETATEFFKERFQTKEWDGLAWPQTKRVVRKGSLLVRSSKLVNSIRPSLVSANKVVISAGNDMVPYAQIHNEGGELHPKVTPAMRKWAWANYYAAGGGASTGSATEGKGKTENKEAAFYKGLALTKKTQLDIVIPKRQFMGHSERLNTKIFERIKGFLNE
ncbi:MAG TPA: hypothetical protein DCR40_18100 [Prolixibacteraceae bacterium]|nr:hypothetical protein [Prolixibacteraceae bacterium]